MHDAQRSGNQTITHQSIGAAVVVVVVHVW
jgi:hypothetical protein